MEQIAYHAIEASSDLAAERGRYSTYDGSMWSQGILPHRLARAARTSAARRLDVDAAAGVWTGTPLREKVLRDGMRNSNVMAIAPTATISNICGVEPVDRADVQQPVREVEHVR